MATSQMAQLNVCQFHIAELVQSGGRDDARALDRVCRPFRRGAENFCVQRLHGTLRLARS
jgi:hypothetical protein